MRSKMLSLAVVFVVAAACTPDARPTANRVSATPIPTPTPVPTAVPTPEPTPEPVPAKPAAVRAAAPAKVKPPAPPAPVQDLSAYDGLGGWIDVFDHTDDPNSIVPAVRHMADEGVKTLYIESSRYSESASFKFPTAVAAALEEAHARGMKVVAWYPPNFADVEKDLTFSLDAVRYVSPNGHRFDAFAADIEYTAGVPDTAERNARAIDYSKRLREGAGPTYPLSAIVIPPSSLRINPGRWPDFPWTTLAGYYEMFMPMNYWTGRKADPDTARALTAENATETKRLTGGKHVHVIGGLADKADAAQVAAYVEAALAGGSTGGGLYDYRITRPEVWENLRRLNR